MSHATYIADLDEDQLTNLIEQATARREAIRQSGWIKLWTLSMGCGNLAWFVEADYSAAVQEAALLLAQVGAKHSGSAIELQIHLERYRPDEVAELLSMTRQYIKHCAAELSRASVAAKA